MDELQLAMRNLLDAGYGVSAEMYWIEVIEHPVCRFDDLKIMISDDTHIPEKPLRVCGYLFNMGEKPIGEIDTDAEGIVIAVERALRSRFTPDEMIG